MSDALGDPIRTSGAPPADPSAMRRNGIQRGARHSLHARRLSQFEFLAAPPLLCAEGLMSVRACIARRICGGRRRPLSLHRSDTRLAPGVSLGKTEQKTEPARLAAQTPCQAPERPKSQAEIVREYIRSTIEGWPSRTSSESYGARRESNPKRNTCGPDGPNGEAFCAARFAGSLLLLGFPQADA